MTTEQAAAWLEARGVRLQPNTIKRHILRGNLPAVKHGRDWWITEEALAAYITNRRNRGKPRRPSPPPTGAPEED